ncbi:MAG TPA: phosphopantetheine-binding protein, partial [Pyrinomonadaceae bacterium]|nr:phosphopantetheine-binding protein [Pyrinomonadaceae bacterium]
QVLFNLLNVSETEITLPGLVLETIALPDAGAKFDLTVYAFEKEEQLRFAFVYNSDLFEATTITRMVECFQLLLAAIARNPELSISLLINELPFTAKRKVDRNAFPTVVAEQRKPAAYLAPSTPAEKIVAEVWAKVLGLERVGRNDNFFEIGGHSLLATQVISRVQETFEVEMPLRSLFEHPTLSEFVIAIEAKVVESVEALSEEEAMALS